MTVAYIVIMTGIISKTLVIYLKGLIKGTGQKSLHIT